MRTDKESILSLYLMPDANLTQYYIGERIDKYGGTGGFVSFLADKGLMFAVRIQR